MALSPIDRYNNGEPESSIEDIEITTFEPIKTPITEYTDGKIQEDHKKLLGDVRTTNFKGYVLGLISVIVLCTPVLIFWLTDNETKNYKEIVYTCSIDENFKVPCGNADIKPNSCTSIGCCWDGIKCFHHYPSKYNYFKSGDVYVASKAKTPFGTRAKDDLVITFHEINSKMLSIYLHEKNDVSYPPLETPKNYTYNYSEELYLAVEVSSTITNKVFFTTDYGPLIASERYWEWTFHMPGQLFGYGQLLYNNTKPITKVFYRNKDDHTTLPKFISHQDGAYYGFSIDSIESPLEITILPSNLIIVKSLARNEIALTLYVGESAKEVSALMRDETYQRPERWVMEPHLCYGPQTDITGALNSLETMDLAPYESFCIHENLIHEIYFPKSANLDQIKGVIQRIKNANKKFVLYIPPHIPICNRNCEVYPNAYQLNVLFKQGISQTLYNGTYNGDVVAYLNLEAENIETFVQNLKAYIINALGDENIIDGLVFMDNWPVEERYKMSWNSSVFPYMSENLLTAMSETLPWNITTNSSNPEPTDDIQHYYNHNKYGTLHLQKFVENLKFPNAKLIMQSSLDNSANIPIMRNINVTWTDLKRTIQSALMHSLLVNPLISSPVCGSRFFHDITQEEKCIRWFVTAATMPMVSLPQPWPTEPSEVYSAYGREAADAALQTRQLLSYYYYNQIKSEPLVRPMFYEFPSDKNTFGLEEQYMIGDALVTAQYLKGASNIVNLYLPVESEWYEFWGGAYIKNGTGFHRVYVVDKDVILYIRGGFIVPMKIDNLTFDLAVPLVCSEDQCTADGVLELDDAVINISANDLTVVFQSETSFAITIRHIKIYKPNTEKHCIFETNSQVNTNINRIEYLCA